MSTRAPHRPLPEPGNPVEVFLIFLRLGLTSFGGPIAHLSYFREEFVNKQKWIGEGQFAQLIAICQFLPGPASSQLGFSVGLIRAGWKGALAAFIAFTAPSALLLIVFAAFLPSLSGPIGDSAIQGLKIVALVVVAHGVMGMLRSLCPDNQRIIIATLGAVAVLVFGSAIKQLAVVAVGALAGILFCRQVQPQPDLSLDVSEAADRNLVSIEDLHAPVSLLSLSRRRAVSLGFGGDKFNVQESRKSPRSLFLLRQYKNVRKNGYLPVSI